jgi:hypothetical protein
MSTSIRMFREKFRKLNLKAAIVETVKAKREVIANLQAIQLSKGQTKKGGEFPDYSPASVIFYGKPPGPWRVKNSGALYKGLFVKNIDYTGWEISSNSETLPLFLTTYAKREWGVNKDYEITSEKIEKARMYTFGLNKETMKGGAENEPFVSGIFKPELKKQITKQTGINIQ